MEGMIVMYSPKKGGFLCGFESIRTRDASDIAVRTVRDGYDERVLAWRTEEDRQRMLGATFEMVHGVEALVDGEGADWQVWLRPDRPAASTTPVLRDETEPPDSDEEGGR